MRGVDLRSGSGMLVALAWLAVVLAIAFAPSRPLAQGRPVATIDGRPVGDAELALAEKEHGADLDGLAPSDRRRALMELLVQRHLLATAAERAGLDKGADFALRLAHARRRLLQDMLLEQRLRAVTEAEARRLYDELAAEFKPEEEIAARHILVESEAVARELAVRIGSGESFAELARSLSRDRETARRGGEFGWRTRGELSQAIAGIAFALAPGSLSTPLRDAAGWHLIRLDARRMRVMPPFAETRNYLLESLAKTALHALVRDLRANAKVEFGDPPTDAPRATPALRR